jgi:uncharacterized protein (TIGR02757 family)
LARGGEFIRKLKDLLDPEVERFNRREFIPTDPIAIPHEYTKRQDIEIAGFFAATLAWGQRKTILAKTRDLLNRMDNRPHEFILHHSDSDLRAFDDFRHRTFNATDALYFIDFFRRHYQSHDSLEELFSSPFKTDGARCAIATFRRVFFDAPYAPTRTGKHVPDPERGSACKRVNMFLRWMVRSDKNGVDFGLWKNISPSSLICPIDLHVERVARQLKMIKRKQVDWQTAEELTSVLRQLDPIDPVKYDFALFGLGLSLRL